VPPEPEAEVGKPSHHGPDALGLLRCDPAYRIHPVLRCVPPVATLVGVHRAYLAPPVVFPCLAPHQLVRYEDSSVIIMSRFMLKASFG
jgi:hypothetical protein